MSASAAEIDHPSPQGPYSTTLRAGGFLFLAGQGALDPATGLPDTSSLDAEVRLTLGNIERLLHSEGYTLDHLVQVVCYLTNLEDWARMNEIYADVLGPRIRPTRTAIGVSSLPFGLSVEMTCIAYREDAALTGSGASA
ncbi:RidA family protein [Paenarthrobacter sp. NPDC056912]|uniref:RidA family protein n=1 Tax=Paenarthrobacter sp. NPDC056912 TaxID=3345965 RepID=UPI003671FCCE